jgi:hypothetical protein
MTRPREIRSVGPESFQGEKALRFSSEPKNVCTAKRVSSLKFTMREQSSVTKPDSFHLLQQIAGGYCLSRTIHVLAELGIADALEDKPLTASELTRSTGVNPDALYRLLRLASAHGIFKLEGDRFSHSDASRMLRSDHPQSMRSFARMFGLAINWGAYADLEHSARTGRPATEKTLPEGGLELSASKS